MAAYHMLAVILFLHTVDGIQLFALCWEPHSLPFLQQLKFMVMAECSTQFSVHNKMLSPFGQIYYKFRKSI